MNTGRRVGAYAAVGLTLLVGACQPAGTRSAQEPATPSTAPVPSASVPRASVPGVPVPGLHGADWSAFDSSGPRATWWVPGTLELALDGGMQRAEARAGGIAVVVLRDAPAKSERIGDRWARDIAADVARTVRGRVRQERVVGGSSTAQTWARGTGDCTEIADLTAELLREQGVRARVAGGVAIQGARPTWHAWVEYWDGRWSTLDPTWAEHPASVGHLRLDAAEASNGLRHLEAYIDARSREQVAGVSWLLE